MDQLRNPVELSAHDDTEVDIESVFEEAADLVNRTSAALGEALVEYRNTLMHHQGCQAWLSQVSMTHTNMQRVIASQAKGLRRRHARAAKRHSDTAASEGKSPARSRMEAYALDLYALQEHKRLSWCDLHSAVVAMSTATVAVSDAYSDLTNHQATYELAEQAQHIARYLEQTYESDVADQ